ncbi:uncharacterized protein LOC111261558 isoform X2 [Varroa jacobsoni]|uniref:uncharacterized protein LOC111261558 isoform X2 n=1 Tax=Varroa jacobsoni TaxID=62625 RepID=UPI000BF5CC8E|nr:uncharacterized protein LOC111261558 isoform X2 [Varroa jacobsoni]
MMTGAVEDLRRCIRSLDVKKVRRLLDELPEGNYQNLGLLQEVCLLKDTPTSSSAIRDFILMLVDFGVDPNSDPASRCQPYYLPPLVAAISNCNVTALRTLLQCSTDLLQLKEVQLKWITPEMKNIIRQFQPGMWIAVHSGNIADVRRLINLWVRMDTLKKLVHHVLARDGRKVKTTLQGLSGKSTPTLRLNLRHLAGQGATVLHYAIRNGDAQIARLLVECGAQLFTVMTDPQGVECPVLFTALNESLRPEMVDALISKTTMCESILQQLLYKSQGILEVAVRNCVPLESFCLLVDRSGPLVLAQRNCQNQTAWDVANELALYSYCDRIDATVRRWIREPRARQVLALHGYPRLTMLVEPDQEAQLPADAQDFLCALPEYWGWIEYLSKSISNQDIKSFQDLSAYQGEHPELFRCDLLWNARVCGDALPLLHKAVLHKNKLMVVEILNAMEPFESIDILVDEYRRTALHYAYATKETRQTKDIVALLYEFGASEHCLDKFGREPLDFKEHSGTRAMESYLEKVRERHSIPAELEREIWRQKSRKVRECKVQTHRQVHAHCHDAPGKIYGREVGKADMPWDNRPASMQTTDDEYSWGGWCTLQ